MPKHDVKFTIPQRQLGKADISFEVKKDNEKFGELKVSSGSAVWFSKNSQQGFRVSWSKLDDIFQKHGSKSEKR